MTNRIADISQRKAARVAGFLYLCVWVFALIPGFIRSSLVVPGDAATTANNIMASEMLFRIGFVIDLIHQACLLLLAWVLYVLFKPVNKNLALLFVLCISVSAAIQCINLLNYSAALHVLSVSDYMTVFETDQLHALAMFYLDLNMPGILIAQIFFGGWLLPLGYLVFKSGYLPRILGVLLMIGSCGYLIDVFISFLFPSYRAISIPGLAVATIAEFSLPMGLLLKGAKIPEINTFVHSQVPRESSI